MAVFLLSIPGHNFGRTFWVRSKRSYAHLCIKYVFIIIITDRLKIRSWNWTIGENFRQRYLSESLRIKQNEFAMQVKCQVFQIYFSCKSKTSVVLVHIRKRGRGKCGGGSVMHKNDWICLDKKLCARVTCIITNETQLVFIIYSPVDLSWIIYGSYAAWQ